MNTSKSNKSLKFKLILLSIGITLTLGTAALGILKYVVSTQEKSQFNSFKAYSQNLGDSISAQFFERYGDIQAFALNPVFRSKDHQSIIDSLNAYAAISNIYDLILVTDTAGNLVSVNNKNPDGKILDVKKLYSRNYANSPWFKAVMNEEFTEDKEKGFSGTFVEDVHIDPITTEVLGENRLGTSFSAALKNEKGQIIGVISNRAGSLWFENAFKELHSQMQKSGYPQTSMSLLNKEGILLYEYVFNEDIKSTKKANYDWHRLLKLNLAATLKSAKNAISKISGAELESDSSGNSPAIFGYSPISGKKFVEKIGWSIIVKGDYAEVMGSLGQAQKIFYGLFALIMGLASLVSYFFSLSLSKSLSTLATRLSQGSTQVLSAATSISKSSSQLSESATEQASAIQETAASIDEVSSMVKKSADNASQSQSVSQSSRGAAEEGQQAVQDMIKAIFEISQSNTAIMNQVENGNRQISEIVKVISEIGNKTKVINDIVFQTKLLSFNASVEAARAGEHGKGFAVVAEEVGNLAQMSGNAAKEISGMLESSIKKVEGIVTETKSKVENLVVESRQKVETGTRVSNRCGEALNKILSTVQEVDGMIGEISSASQEQAQGVSEINKAMNQLDQVTQQNSTIAQNAATSASQLNNQANELRQLVEDLFYVINGKSNNELHPLQNNFNQPETGLATVIDFPARKSELNFENKSNILKIAVGSDDSVPKTPSFEDPRFEDV